MKSNIFIITTPEGVVFPLYLAGPISRSIAWVIDILTILVIIKICSMTAGFLGFLSPELEGVFMVFLYFIVTTGYGIILEWYWKGKTLGKHVMKLKVADKNGLELGFNQVFIRNLMRVIDILPFFYCIGGTVSLFSNRYQRLGDMVAQTVVTRNIKIGEPDLKNILSDKYNSLKKHPQLISRLKNSISPEDVALLFKAILRRDSLDADQRNKIYGELVEYIQAKVRLPQEITDGLSNERLIRNVLDINN